MWHQYGLCHLVWDVRKQKKLDYSAEINFDLTNLSLETIYKY